MKISKREKMRFSNCIMGKFMFCFAVMTMFLSVMTVIGAEADSYSMFRDFLMNHEVTDYICSSEVYPVASIYPYGMDDNIVKGAYFADFDSDGEYELCIKGPEASGNGYLSILDNDNGQIRCVVNEWAYVYGYYFQDETNIQWLVLMEGNGEEGDAHFQVTGYNKNWERQVFLDNLITAPDEAHITYYDGWSGNYIDSEQYHMLETSIRENCAPVVPQIIMDPNETSSINDVCDWLYECSMNFGNGKNGNQLYNTASSSDTYAYDEDTWFYISSTYKDGIALHPNPDPDSATLDRLPYLTVFHGNEFSGTYVFTEYNGQTGWLNIKYAKEITKPENQGGSFPIDTWYQITSTYHEGIAVHPVPNKDSELLGRISHGEKFFVKSGYNNYGFTIYNDVAGWINLDYAEPSENGSQGGAGESSTILSTGTRPLDGYYLLPDSNTRVYSESELKQLPLQVLNYARNEIFAKYGRMFKSQELMDYFSSMPWYSGTISPDSFDSNVLNPIEKQNIETMYNIEYADGVGYQLDQPGYDITKVFSYFATGDRNDNGANSDYHDGADKDAVLRAYADFLSQQTILIHGTNERLTDSTRVRFALPMIDSDDIPELLVRYDDANHAEGYADLFYWNNGNLERVWLSFNMEENMVYYPGTGIFTDNGTWQGYGSTDYLRLLPARHINDHIGFQIGTIPTNNAQGDLIYSYYTNGIEISEDLFYQKLASFTGGVAPAHYDFYSNTAENRNMLLLSGAESHDNTAVIINPDQSSDWDDSFKTDDILENSSEDLGEAQYVAYFKSSITGDDCPLEFNYSDRYFDQESTILNTQISKASIALASAAYGQNLSKSILKQMGFSDIKQYNYEKKATPANCDFVAYSIANKTINTKNGKRNLVIVMVRGTPGSYEWYSNFNVGKTGEHTGFFTAAQEIVNTVIPHLEKGNNADNLLWVTGHSRGAAVANIVAGVFSLQYVDLIRRENVYGYTFACPAVSVYADTGLDNIYNFCNPGDMVTQVPLANWGYKRYGQDVPLKNTKKIKKIYKDLTKRKYHGFIKKTSVISSMGKWLPSVNDLYEDIKVERIGYSRYLSKHDVLIALSTLLVGDKQPGDGSFAAGVVEDVLMGKNLSLPHEILWSYLGNDISVNKLDALYNSSEARLLPLGDGVADSHCQEFYYAWASAL